MFDVSLGSLKPLRYVEIQNYIFEDQDPMDDKAQELVSPFSNFNVLLLGSSLLAATAGVDFMQDHVVRTSIAWNFHTKARALDQLLKSQLHVNAHSFNMGIAACMVQEDKLILEKTLQSGHHPPVLMLFLAPRDFIDNSHSPNAHVYKYFAQQEAFWKKLSWRASLQQNFDGVVGGLSNLYRSRGHYMKVLELAACATLHRAPNLFYANQGDKYWREFTPPQIIAPIFKNNKPRPLSHEDAVKKMGKYYEVAYLPVNYRRYHDEMSGLQQLLELANQNKILTLVVNMPRGSFNENMLPSDFRAKYMQDIAATCARAHIKCINLEGSPTFDDNDFSDAVHLTPQGGAKFLGLLCDNLKNDPAFATQLQRALATH